MSKIKNNPGRVLARAAGAAVLVIAVSVQAEQWGSTNNPDRLNAPAKSSEAAKKINPPPSGSTPQTREHVLLRQAPSELAAVTRAPAKRHGAVQVGAHAWQCRREGAGTHCTLRVTPLPEAAGACRALAGALGALASFAVAGKPFSGEQLKTCNAGAARGAGRSTR